MDAVYIVVVLSTLLCVHAQRYIVPEAQLQFLNPRGLKISIPDDDPEIKLVAFHINVNEEFTSLQHGHFGADIIKKKDGRWTYHIPNFRAKQGDVIYYWIHVIVDKLAYNGLDREYRVKQANPHGVGSSGGTSPSPPAPPDHSGQSSITTRGPFGSDTVMPGEVILDHHFSNTDGWKHQVTIGGNTLEDDFMVFTKDRSNSFINNGKLVIKPALLEDKSNDTFVREGELVLQGCTSFVAEQCVRRAYSYIILPPITSARLTTKDHFTFRYGTVEIRAKLPRGNWIVPELWLEPVSGPKTQRIVMGLARGNMDDSEFGSKTLEAGVMGQTDELSSMGKKRENTPWTQNYHTFKINWRPDGIRFLVDDQQIHRIPSVNFSILSKEVYLTLGVHVAGSRDFDDSIADKPWGNTSPKSLEWENYPLYIIETYEKFQKFLKFWEEKSNWYPTWNDDSALQVDYVKVTAL